MRIRDGLLGLACLGLLAQARCTHSSSEAVTEMPADLRADSFVSEIHIKEVPLDSPANFENTLAAALQRAMPSCATGKRPLILEVRITKFRAAGAAATILIGGANAIEGSARLIQPDSAATVGDYDIVTSTGGGGTIAAIAMANAARAMTHDFASDLCQKAFGRNAEFSAPATANGNPPPKIVMETMPEAAPNQPALPQAPPPSASQPWHEAPSQ